MTERVFIWVAHPGEGSFNSALADAYERGARESGAEVRRMELSEMVFSTEFRGYGQAPVLEPDLLRWQNNAAWADRIFIVHPLWWGAMPALAKTVLDRALTPGFAYKYKARGVAWDKLLEGKVGDAIITADTPGWVDTWLNNKPSRRVLAKGVYDFCGIKPRKVELFGSIKTSDETKRSAWLERAVAMGARSSTPKSRPAVDAQPALSGSLAAF